MRKLVIVTYVLRGLGFVLVLLSLFGHSLKSRYDPKGKDVVTEELVRKWEKGEFDALYYSIFFEYPKKPVLPDV